MAGDLTYLAAKAIRVAGRNLVVGDPIPEAYGWAPDVLQREINVGNVVIAGMPAPARAGNREPTPEAVRVERALKVEAAPEMEVTSVAEAVMEAAPKKGPKRR